jgi:hypothetical protein
MYEADEQPQQSNVKNTKESDSKRSSLIAWPTESFKLKVMRFAKREGYGTMSGYVRKLVIADMNRVKRDFPNVDLEND